MKRLIGWVKRTDALTKVAIFLFLVWVAFTPFYEKGDPLSPSDTVIVLGAVVVQILVGVKGASLVTRFLSKQWRERWEKGKLQDTTNFYATLASSSWPYEKIANVLLSKSTKERLSPSEAFEAPHLRQELDRLLRLSRSQKEEQKKPPSYYVSKLLFQARTLCQKMGESVLADAIGKQYSLAKRIQRADIYASSLLTTSLVGFLAGFGLSAVALSWLLGEKPVVLLNWLVPIGLAVTGLLSYTVLFKLASFGVRSFTEKSWTEWDDIFVSIVSYPVSIAATLVAFALAVGLLPPYILPPIKEGWSWVVGHFIWRIIVIVFLGWIAIAVFNRVLMYWLKRWATSTETKYDDMFVRIVQVFGSFLLGAIALGAVIVNFQPQLKAATGLDNLLLPYSIVVGILSALLGYSSREALENFFSGVLLQIDKPFDRGDRLVLETGEICDVVGLGMRSTILYNVLQNTEVSVPNRVLANQKITNISRPDRQLRIQVPVMVPNEGDSLSRAEEILLDIAYMDNEVDEARFSDEEVSGLLKDRGRMGLTALVKSIETTFPQIRNTLIPRIVGGDAHEESVFEGSPAKIYEHLGQLSKLRREYKDLESQERARLVCLMKIVQEIAWVNEALLAISELYSETRRDMEDMIAEVQKEPVIYSRFCVTEEGHSYISIELNVYTLHLARRFEVVNRLNKEIQKRFASAGIKVP